MYPEERRAIVLAPVGQDAAAMAAALSAERIAAVVCADPGECVEAMEVGAGALLMTEEALELPGATRLLESLQKQPVWSELPVIILTSGGESRLIGLLDVAASAARGVTLLERPIRAATLLRAVQVALRSRQKQYQVRDLMAEQEQQHQALQASQDALRESEERFRSLADGTPVLIWVHGVDGELRFVNRSWIDFFGLTLEQARSGWGPLVHSEDANDYKEAFLRCHEERREFRAQARVRRHDGEWRWIESIGVPRFTSHGEFLGMAGSSVDITERKKAESVLARSREELEELVAERTARLQELVAELEHFSYSITHDMRAPLRAMMAFSEEVLEMCSASGQEEQKRFLQRIVSASRRMDLLITDALNYGKAIRNELPLAPIDVNRLLRGMLDTYPELQVAHADIHVEGQIPLVMGNEAGLIQCLSNLLGNAVKFSQPGKRPEVKVRGETRDGCVRLWVEDKGIGIDKRMVPRLFDMFVRGSGPQAGTGIGLALARKVVDRMGGKVGVESEAGRGSRFWVELKAGGVDANRPRDLVDLKTS